MGWATCSSVSPAGGSKLVAAERRPKVSYFRTPVFADMHKAVLVAVFCKPALYASAFTVSCFFHFIETVKMRHGSMRSLTPQARGHPCTLMSAYAVGVLFLAVGSHCSPYVAPFSTFSRFRANRIQGSESADGQVCATAGSHTTGTMLVLTSSFFPRQIRLPRSRASHCPDNHCTWCSPFSRTKFSCSIQSPCLQWFVLARAIFWFIVEV